MPINYLFKSLNKEKEKEKENEKKKNSETVGWGFFFGREPEPEREKSPEGRDSGHEQPGRALNAPQHLRQPEVDPGHQAPHEGIPQVEVAHLERADEERQNPQPRRRQEGSDALTTSAKAPTAPWLIYRMARSAIARTRRRRSRAPRRCSCRRRLPPA